MQLYYIFHFNDGLLVIDDVTPYAETAELSAQEFQRQYPLFEHETTAGMPRGFRTLFTDRAKQALARYRTAAVVP